MSDEVFEQALVRIVEHCSATGQQRFTVVFHGGEPCLLGEDRFDAWCGRLREVLGKSVHLNIVIQTNGTLLNPKWIESLKRHRVSVGLSLDGPKEINDANRFDHSRRGSYEKVIRGLRALQEADVPHGVGCVIPLGENPLTVHRHFLELGCRQITYLMPHFTHDTIAPIRERFGPTPCADFLIPIFDDWWFEGTIDVTIEVFKNIARVIMGGRSRSEGLGNNPPGYVFIEPDGEMEGLDNLRACADGLSQIGLNIRDSSFSDLLQSEVLVSQAIHKRMPLAQSCLNCRESETCAGGYLPHRYSRARGFDNPSVWCEDLLKLFDHLRSRLDVDVGETRQRRTKLELAQSSEAAFEVQENQLAYVS
jgi:uncharacterized protein